MGYCSVSNCGNCSGKGDCTARGITFHCFPKDPDIKEKWIMATGKTNWFPTNNSRLCSVHFREDDFLPTAKRKILSKFACPTIAVWTSTERSTVDSQPSSPVLPKPVRQTIVTEQRMKIRSLQCKNRRYLEKIKRLEEILRISEERRLMNGDIAFYLANANVHRNEWLQNIGRPDLLTREHLKSSSYRVCSIHFEDSVLSCILVRKLLPGATPTKFLSGSQQARKEKEDDNLSIDRVKKVSMITISTQTDPIEGSSGGVEMPKIEQNMGNRNKVDGCQNKSGKDVSFFKLPKDEERRKQWCDLIGRPDLAGPNIKFGSHIVCNRHFAKSDMTIIPRLNPKALPSRELPNQPSTFKGIKPKELDKIDSSSQTDGITNMVDKSIQTKKKVNDQHTQTVRRRKLSEELRKEKRKTMKLQKELDKLKELQKTGRSFNEEATKRLKTIERQDVIRNSVYDIKGEPGYGAILEAARTIQEPCTVCCVFGCQTSVRVNPDKDFFPFPTKPARYLNWLKLINREDLVDKMGAGDTNHWVCSDHFDDADFVGEALTDEANPHLKLPTKSGHIEYVHCGDEIAEIKMEPVDELEAMEVEVHFEPEVPPTVTSNAPQITQDHRQKTSVPAIPIKANILQSEPAASDATPVHFVNNEIPTFTIYKNQDHTPIPMENFEIPVTNISKNLFAKPAVTDPLKTKEKYLKNAAISCIEHISLPIEEDENSRSRKEVKSVVVQTTKDLIDKMNAPLKKKYAEELKEANEKLRKVEAMSKNPCMDRNKFIEACEKYLDEKIANIVKSHASLFEKSKGNRYSQNFKMFALNLYLCSPQSYKFVEQFFCLPSMTTIHRLQTPIRTGFNENLMQSFTVKVNQMSEKEKMCTVCFDYMDVNRNLYYDVRNDFIWGLHEIDQKQGTEPAKYALVIMVRGMYSKWRQPVSFALVAEKKCYPELKEWLHKTIALLFDIGLNVKAFVANQETEFLDFSDTSVTESFFVCGRKICQIFDVPFLFKNAREDFLKYEFHFGKKVAKLSHVFEVYDADQQQELRLMPKITDHHLRPTGESENDVKISIELFSRSVAAALNFHVITNMVSKKVNDTVEFIQLMNNLFDILNSTKLSSEYEFKKAYRGTQEQNKFLKASLEYLQQLVMVDEAGNVIQKRNFVTGLMITIKSLINLMEDLQKENIKYILTKHLSKDCMEGYFKKVRELSGMAHARPTSVMFSRSFKRLFLINLVSNTKKGGTETDLKSTLAKISDYVNLDVDWKKEDEESNRCLSVGVLDYQKLWPVPPTDFITGYLIWKCLEKHQCETLVETLCRQYAMEVDIDSLLNKFKEYNGNNMKAKSLLPLPFDFKHFVERLDRIFQEYAATHGVSMFGFGGFVYTKMEAETFETPCECFPLKFMKYLFIRIKIFHMVKDYNMKNKPIRHSSVKKQ